MRNYTKKAQSKDPCVFWNTVKEIRNGRQARKEMTIEEEGQKITCGTKLANMFGNFFTKKVLDLSEQTEPEPDIQLQLDCQSLSFTAVEVGLVARTLKSKKLSGVDDIPMCIVKDSKPLLRGLYLKFFNKAAV